VRKLRLSKGEDQAIISRERIKTIYLQQNKNIMTTRSKKQVEKIEKENKVTAKKKKSKTRLFWDEYLNGVKGEITDMRAVLK